MNQPNNRSGPFYGDPNATQSPPFNPYSSPFQDNRRRFSPYVSSTPKQQQSYYGLESNVPLNLSRRSPSDSPYECSPHQPNLSPVGYTHDYRSKFKKVNRNHSFQNSSGSFNDSRQSRPLSFYRNKRDSSSSSETSWRPSFNINDYVSPSMLEDPWKDLEQNPANNTPLLQTT